MIELQNRDLVCTIVPELGAAVTRLAVVRKGRTYDVLAPAPQGATDPRQMSLAHIAPFGGPVRNNTFKWDSRPYFVEPNFADEPLFRNGVAWQNAWTGKKDGKYSATLKYVHKKQPGWPFDFSLVVVYDLEEDHLIVTYELQNETRQGTCPIGLGTTLRLPRVPKMLLSAGVGTIWTNDEQGVPRLSADVPFNLDLKEGLSLDGFETPERWYADWTGKATLDYADSRLSTMIKGDGEMKFLGIAAGKHEDYLRLSTLSHVPGALDIKGYDEDQTGLRTLGPGDGFGAQLKVDVDLSVL